MGFVQIKLINEASKEEYSFEPTSPSSPVILDDAQDGLVELPVRLSDAQRQRLANNPLWQALGIVKYEVEIKTGVVNNAGTDANVHVTLVGERGDTGVRRLKKSLNNQNKFEKGKVSCRLGDSNNCSFYLVSQQTSPRFE
jgi:hypothetical protein